MKKSLIIVLGVCLLVSSCGSYEASGAYTGSMFGNMIGSAVGGIAGGWRGHELGSLIGTVGGAAVGAAIGASADRKYQEDRAAARQSRRAQQAAVTRREQRGYSDDTYSQRGYNQGAYSQGGSEQSGFDPQMRGDDRITFSEGSGSDGYPSAPISPSSFLAGNNGGPALQIRNAGVYENQRDGVISRGEQCSVVFEITNTSNQPVYDVYPLVKEMTGNKHVHISPNLRVESIAPHQSIRYTASLLADKGLRDGQIVISVGVAQGNRVVEGQERQISVRTAKRVR